MSRCTLLSPWAPPPKPALHDTGLFGFKSFRLGELPEGTDAVDLDGIAESKEPMALLHKLLRRWLTVLPEHITDKAYMHRAENYGDCWLVFFSPQSKNGLWITHGEVKTYRGVWSLTGGQHSWAAAERTDLAASVEQGKLELSALK